MRHYETGVSILLLDLMMPGIDGFEVLAKMQESIEMSSIPVIVVSGEDERDTTLKAIKAGAADYITKPVDADVIRLRVRSVVSRAENERLRAQNSYLLLQSGEEAKYRTVLDSTGMVLIELDWASGVFTYDASITEHIFGVYDKRRLWHIFLSDMVAEAMDVKKMQDLVHDVANDRNQASASMKVVLKTPSKEKHTFRMSVYKRANEFDLTDKIIITFLDINDEVLAENKLRFQAEIDDLTKIYNRRTFLNKVSDMVENKPPNSYIMAVGDIDGFKIVNDRFGHAAGDKLLIYAAARLKEAVEQIGGICGRIGNDVFAALVAYDPALMIKMDSFPRELFSNYPLDYAIECSIGYYLIDDNDMNSDDILDRTTLARQTVKQQYGSKSAWYDNSMRDSLLREREITDSMASALEEKQFDIYLQPQYDHHTGVICGAEALVRWIHPTKGIIYPSEFIPLFEKNGSITRLDEYVWDRTAQCLKQWIQRGYKVVPVSVNVSRFDAEDPNLCEKLHNIVKKYDIPVELFRIEITESIFAQNTASLVEVVDKLHSFGFLVEMDDFGSGYSSLNILKDIPVDILKLDMRFFSGTDDNGRGGTILTAIMRMARWLNIDVIAEGVELLAQADFLSSIGCGIIQGYLYAKPMPVTEFEKLLLKGEVSQSDVFVQEDSLPNALFNPDGIDSKMFDEYIGAAVIYAFDCLGDTFEALRVNKSFMQLLRFDMNMSLPLKGLVAMHKEDIPLFVETAKRAISSAKNETVDVRRVFEGSEEMMYLRVSMKVVTYSDDNALLLCMVSEK